MRKLILAGALALAAMPASALAADVPSAAELAKASCKTQKAEMGAKVFKQTYGAKSIGKAVKACAGVTEDVAAAERTNAAKACKAERDGDPAAFAHHGTNDNDRNAYGKCVSSTVKQAMAKETEATVAAAKACKVLQDGDKATFDATYGTKKNAFGKCVSATAAADKA